MPSESDNKMEELVKAYAKKRRDEAGASFELHPATRKLLQGEVARQWPKGKGRSASFLQLLLTFWPRLAFVGALVLAIGAVIWATSSRPDAEQRMARNTEQPSVDFLADGDRAGKDAPARTAMESKKREPALTLARPERGAETKADDFREKAPKLDALKLADDSAVVTAPAPPLTPLASAPMPTAGGRLDRGADESKTLTLNKAPEPSPSSRSLAVQLRDAAPQPGSGAGAFGGGGAIKEEGLGRRSGLAGSGNVATEASGRDYGLLPAKPFVREQTEGTVSQTAVAKQLESFGYSANAPVATAKPGERSYSLAVGLDTNSATPLGGASETRIGVTAGVAPVDKLSQADRKLTLNARQDQGGLVGDSVFYKNRALNETLATDQPQTPANNRAPTPGAAPAGLSRQLGRNEPASEQAGQRLYFSQVGEPSKAGQLQSQAAQALLGSFGLEQNGDRIRIYDADGSVYEGQVTASADAAVRLRRAPANEKAKLQLENLDVDKNGIAQKTPELLGEAESVPLRTFRASGTNRSLNQLVVINGSLVSGAGGKPEAALPALHGAKTDTYNSAPAPLAAPAPGPPSARYSAPAQPPTNLRSAVNEGLHSTPPITRVLGRARVGATNELDINAVPAPR